jgi:hypothetical protein
MNNADMPAAIIALCVRQKLCHGGILSEPLSVFAQIIEVPDSWSENAAEIGNDQGSRTRDTPCAVPHLCAIWEIVCSDKCIGRILGYSLGHSDDVDSCRVLRDDTMLATRLRQNRPHPRGESWQAPRVSARLLDVLIGPDRHQLRFEKLWSRNIDSVCVKCLASCTCRSCSVQLDRDPTRRRTASQSVKMSSTPPPLMA